MDHIVYFLQLDALSEHGYILSIVQPFYGYPRPFLTLGDLQMSDIFAIKRAQQEEHLKQLREAPKEVRNKLALQNSGFAAFLRKNRHLIKIRFSG